jgi:hypothetical protein
MWLALLYQHESRSTIMTFAEAARRALHGVGGGAGLPGGAGAQPHLSSWKPRRRSPQRTCPAVLVMMCSTRSTLHSNLGSLRASSTCNVGRVSIVAAKDPDADAPIEEFTNQQPWANSIAAASEADLGASYLLCIQLHVHLGVEVVQHQEDVLHEVSEALLRAEGRKHLLSVQ